jgi:murein tripeptide amidase MpaA
MRWIIAVLASLLLVATIPISISAAPSATATTANLKAWTADVPAEVVAEMREAGVDVTAEETLESGLQRIEVIATNKQLQPFRGPDGQFRKTKGQERVERTPDVNTGENVFRAYDGPEGLEAEMVAIANANPDLVKLVDIGDTVQGRDIWALKVAKNANQRPDGTKPAVLYNSAQHAREWITPEMTRRLTRHYLDNYGSDAEITELVDNNELWFIGSVTLPDRVRVVACPGDPSSPFCISVVRWFPVPG